MFRRIFPGLILIGALAAQAPQRPRAPRKPVFISASQLDVAALLPDPPAMQSPEGKAELAEVHRLQAERRPDQITRAKGDDGEEDIFVFKNVLGAAFNADALPLTARLSAHLHGDEGIIVGPAKSYFRKRRPFNVDATVLPVCRTNANPDDFSYPSGHAATGYLEALALMMIVPEKRDAILARADDYAYNRVVCGVHFPSDVAASKTVAYAMMGVILNNPQFQEEFAAARAETRKALGLSGDAATSAGTPQRQPR
jgi:acid phosphatase (class A)